MRLLLYDGAPAPRTISSGSQRSREGYIVSSTKEGARARRNRTRAAITTVAALVAAAAMAGSAQAAISVSPGNHPNGFPMWYADTPGNQLGLCVDDPVLCPGGFTSADLKGPDG